MLIINFEHLQNVLYMFDYLVPIRLYYDYLNGELYLTFDGTSLIFQLSFVLSHSDVGYILEGTDWSFDSCSVFRG